MERADNLYRRRLLKTGGLFLAGVILEACVPGNMPKLTPTPHIFAPEKVKDGATEIFDPRIIEDAQKEMLNLKNYTINLRQKMVNFWLQGEIRTVEYQSTDGQSYLFSFNPAKPDRELKDLARTTVSLERRSLSTGGSALVFVLSGSYNSTLAEELSEPVKNRIRTMNFEHEGIVSIAFINGLINVGKSLGMNFRFPSVPPPQETQQRRDIQRYLPKINGYAEAVAEINDYILTYPLLDKDPQGKVLFISYPGNKKPLPLIQGKVFLEAGLTFIVDQTIGSSLKGINSFDQLSQIYLSLEKIPGSLEYLKQIQQHFQSES